MSGSKSGFFEVIAHLAIAGVLLATTMSQLNSLAERTRAAPESFPLVMLNVDGVQVVAQHANTESLRQQGLMWQHPPLSHGMWLSYPSPQVIALWMKNTPAPLDVAFVGPDSRVIGFATMQPYSEQTHISPGVAIAALEMPAGWFAQHRVEIGDQVTVDAALSEP